MKFRATHIECWSQNQVETVFFGNQEDGLALLMSNVPGTADHYLEWKDQANACINAVEVIQLTGDSLRCQLSPEAAEKMGETAFKVEFDCEVALFEEISKGLKLIFQDKFSIKATGLKQKETPKQDYSKIKYLNLEGKNLKQLPEYVAEMTALETVKIGSNPRLDFDAACKILALLPHVKTLSCTVEGNISESLGKLTQLESLTISGMHNPCRLPESIGQLKRLKSLLVMSDAEVILPESFATLQNLESLNMRVSGWNLPSTFYLLNKLKTLDFSNCHLRQVPEEMVRMSAVESIFFCCPEVRDYDQILAVVAQMPNVKVLEMRVNPIPSTIGLCKNIEEFTIWGGSDSENPLHLPDEFFELKQLKSLSLNMCYFDKIPEGIGKLTQLKSLSFMESVFETLPDSIGALSALELLNITENPALKSLPDSLGALSQLSSLSLVDNPLLRELPPSAQQLTGLHSICITNQETIKRIPDSWRGISEC